MRLLSLGGFGLTLFVVGFFVVGTHEDPGVSGALTDLPAVAGAPAQASGLEIWYLGHCGFAVRSGRKLLVFDYLPERGTPSVDPEAPGLADGIIDPADLEGLDVYVFTTHSHSDHFDPVILEWEEEVDGIQYFFGWEAGENPAHHYLVGPRATQEVDGMEIYTINSHHSGVPEVAYLIHLDGRWVYHNGDYRQDYIPDFQYLATLTDHMDLVFHAGLVNPEWQYTQQGLYLLEHFSPDLFFPIHNGGNEEEGEAFAADVSARGFETEVPVPRRRGDRWVLGR